jgi:hypothetical protein
VAPGWLLYVPMVWLLPAVNPACYTLGANERLGNRQLGIKPAVKQADNNSGSSASTSRAS